MTATSSEGGVANPLEPMAVGVPETLPVWPWFSPLAWADRLLLLFFPVVWLLGLVRGQFGEVSAPAFEIGQMVGFTVAVLAPSFVRARREALGALLQRFVPGEAEAHTLYGRLDGRMARGWDAALFGLVLAGAFVMQRWGVVWDLLPYRFAATRWGSLIYGALGFYCFARAVWLFLAFSHLVGRLTAYFEREQQRIFSWELLEVCGRGYVRTALGTSVLSFCMLWMAVVTHRLFVGASGDPVREIGYIVLLSTLALFMPLTYLVVPQWRLHRILVARKRSIRALFGERLLTLERQVLADPKRELVEAYLHERQLLGEIDNLPEWPFRIGAVAQIVTVVGVPVVLFLIKEVLVDVIVELVKR